MNSAEKLLLENKAWAREKSDKDRNYFTNLAKGQNPHFLWIGCSDSRVPANEVTNSEPGDMFVHRNIANIVVHTDFNLLSVLQYSVEVLKVEHIIVCGHYGCGGVKAALGHQQLGLINKWLRNLKDLYRVHYEELNALFTDDEKADRLVELNVQEQVANLAKTSIIQAAWHHRSTPMLHGWVYDMTDGQLKPLTTFGPDDKLDDIYRFDFTTSPR